MGSPSMNRGRMRRPRVGEHVERVPVDQARAVRPRRRPAGSRFPRRPETPAPQSIVSEHRIGPQWPDSSHRPRPALGSRLDHGLGSHPLQRVRTTSAPHEGENGIDFPEVGLRAPREPEAHRLVLDDGAPRVRERRADRQHAASLGHDPAILARSRLRPGRDAIASTVDEHAQVTQQPSDQRGNKHRGKERPGAQSVGAAAAGIRAHLADREPADRCQACRGQGGDRPGQAERGDRARAERAGDRGVESVAAQRALESGQPGTRRGSDGRALGQLRPGAHRSAGAGRSPTVLGTETPAGSEGAGDRDPGAVHDRRARAVPGVPAHPGGEHAEPDAGHPVHRRSGVAGAPGSSESAGRAAGGAAGPFGRADRCALRRGQAQGADAGARRGRHRPARHEFQRYGRIAVQQISQLEEFAICNASSPPMSRTNCGRADHGAHGGRHDRRFPE
ncbi:hypothetical protein FQA39_LY18590 [Lamprigera yunnana]|nr:hypothetical protein FQA39_LY18590 [Lamprigera yunnana]